MKNYYNNYRGAINEQADDVKHWKYIKKKVNGKWRYYDDAFKYDTQGGVEATRTTDKDGNILITRNIHKNSNKALVGNTRSNDPKNGRHLMNITTKNGTREIRTKTVTSESTKLSRVSSKLINKAESWIFKKFFKYR